MTETTQTSPKDTSREKRRVYVVLPVYNEEARIESLLDHIDEAMQDAEIPFRVLLVDDGSRDLTGKIVEGCATRMPIHMMHHEVNLGLTQLSIQVVAFGDIRHDLGTLVPVGSGERVEEVLAERPNLDFHSNRPSRANVGPTDL